MLETEQRGPGPTGHGRTRTAGAYGGERTSEVFEGHCPHCGWADSTPFHTVSQHRTGGGMTIWTRCQCGSLQMRTVDAAGGRIVTRGRPAPDAAGGPFPAAVREREAARVETRVERCHDR